jgi:hypothetical protein
MAHKLQNFPEDFYAEKADNVIYQWDQFNAAHQRNTTEGVISPISAAVMNAPRLQVDLRTVNTARAVPAGPAPVIAFLSDLRGTLFKWATYRLLSLAPKAKKSKYPFSDLYNILLLPAVHIDPTEIIRDVGETKQLFNKLVWFEMFVRWDVPAPDGTQFVPYLVTLAKAMEAGKSISELKNASDKWVKTYENQIGRMVDAFLSS